LGKYEQLAKEIVKNVGGKENILGLVHCVTRLRFTLKDESKAKDDVLKNMDGVVTVMKSTGQYQVVIGNHVPEVFKEVCKVANIDVNADNKEKKKMTLKEKFFDILSGIFVPLSSVLVASGMIKGILAILSTSGILTADNGLYILLNAVGDAMFFFIPIMVGYTTAKKLGLSIFLGLTIGAFLCYPKINGADLVIFGMAFKATYTSTVLPAIVLVALAAPLERFFNKVVPTVIKNFVTPMLVLLITLPLGYMVIGPAANYLATLLSSTLISIYGISPIVSGLVIGSLYQVMVIFGIHSIFIVTIYMNVLGGVPDPSYAALGVASFAQTGVVMAIWLKTKNKKLKEIALPAWISGLFGVTEPAIYGVTLPRIKHFIVSCVAAGIAGGVVGVLGLKIYTIPGMGIFKIPGYINPEDSINSLILAIAVSVLALVLGFIGSIVLFKDDEQNDKDNTKEVDSKQIKKETLLSPMKGNVIPLSDIEDDAFSQGLLGNGVAIEPTEGKVVAPCNGTIMTLFPTKHAIGIVSDNGCEVLIHIGVDTVKLEGKYFESYVKQGDKVKAGDLLVTFELDKIHSEGYSTKTPVIVTNSKDYLDVVSVTDKKVNAKDELLSLLI